MENLNKKEKGNTNDDTGLVNNNTKRLSKKENDNTNDDTGLLDTNTKKHGQCGDDKIAYHLHVYRISIVLCIGLLGVGTILIFIGNYTNTGLFAIWAISNQPWPTIKFDNFSTTVKYVQFLQWSCWISGFFCFVYACFLIFLACTYSKLNFSNEPWVWSKWNPVRKDANNWIRSRPSFLLMDEKKQWDMMNSKQQDEILKYNQEGMFSLKKVNQKSQNLANIGSKV